MILAKKIIRFQHGLSLDAELPDGIGVLDPLSGPNAKVIDRTINAFYNKYYGDNEPRKLLIGINPGRLGAGLTGIPFSDTKRLASDCDIHIKEFSSHEPSSVFVYEVVRAFGGAEAFYKSVYITSASPLGFVEKKENGKEVNYNYYDSKELQDVVTPFILRTLREQISWGLETETAYCLGTGKNYKYLNGLNKTEKLFGRIVPLEHPRYITQYRSKRMQEFVDKYLKALT